MQITINGEKRELSGNLTIVKMLENLGLPADRIAVELNREVIRKKDWESVRLNDADKIEIIHFVGGG
ncbi:MAG TPA: sulfur carrier protein ThiS [Pyrinomonadaceae bacterium]|jgi:thiamine biosynthesis protein ThiS